MIGAVINNLWRLALALPLLVGFFDDATAIPHKALESRDVIDRMIFAHFMVGIVEERGSASDWDADMQAAQAAGIDAFALNIGTDQESLTQLGYAYQSAENNGMKVFISFDGSYWSTDNAALMSSTIQQYAGNGGQLLVDNRAFVSTFYTNTLDIGSIKANSGVNPFFVPNMEPEDMTDDCDGLFSWRAWPNNGVDSPPDSQTNITTSDGDEAYVAALNGKPYMAPVSPWFSTHYGQEVSYAKNWVFGDELLWYNRWNEVLQLQQQYIELVTWNDYGESHYLGPLSSAHHDDGASKWVNDMPHDAFLTMAKPYMAAWKANSLDVTSFITSDSLTYWYRSTVKGVECAATDNCEEPASATYPDYFVGKPNGWDLLNDNIFVVALLTEAGTVTVTSGDNEPVTLEAQQGQNSFTIPFTAGSQKFELTRNGNTILSGTSLKSIDTVCTCGFYNFNAYSGSLPTATPASLRSDAYSNFDAGLPSPTCIAQPSLYASN